ncbi:MAG: YdcF family protein [Alphaproteobacteria bacterium]|nr:YdcF family protein [Alphaproteobacteria bacterium]
MQLTCSDKFSVRAKPQETCSCDYVDPAYIRDYSLIEKTELAPADIILIFGNPHIIEQAAEHAARLYKTGMGKKIVVTGGALTQDDIPEATALYEALRSHGIPAQDIITETLSENTQENIEFAKDKLSQKLPDFSVRSAIAIGTVVAGRRFLMTLKKHWPEVFAMASHVNPFEVDLDEWAENKKLQKIVLREFNKIDPYIEAGYLEEVCVPTINQKAKKLRKAALSTPRPQQNLAP